MSIKILFFIEGLSSGGKERRLVELLKYLKHNTEYEFMLILTEKDIFFKDIMKLGIPIKIIKRHYFKKDPILFFKFFFIARQYKPDIIHTWGEMTTFYAIPSIIILNIPLVSNMITNAKRNFSIFSFSYLFFKLNCIFSDLILSNSQAGINAYKPNKKKAKVIYNGVDLSRFSNKYDIDLIKKEIGIKTSFVIIMVASFSKNKNYDLFLDTAKNINNLRKDITFLAVGDGNEMTRIKTRVKDENISNILFTGKVQDVERIIAISDISLLCTFSEGISNSIIESLAMGKPVITTDVSGGSCELINNETGYIIESNADLIIEKIGYLLDNANLRYEMGEKAKELIRNNFSINKMGKSFIDVYNSQKIKR